MNRDLLARSAVQGAWWAFAWRVFLFSAVVQAAFFFGMSIAAEIAVLSVVAGTAAFLWLMVRIVVPTLIRLGRHYRGVHDLSVPADPALAKAIVIAQWSCLRTDLMLPWRAIRG